jgi:hypothetical protein
MPLVSDLPSETPETPKLRKKYNDNLEGFNRILKSHAFQQHKEYALNKESDLRPPYKFGDFSFGTYIPDSNKPDSNKPDSNKPDEKRPKEPKDPTAGNIKILSNTEKVIKIKVSGIIPGKKTVVSFYKDISLYGALLSLAHMKNSGSTTLVSSSMITLDDLQLIESSSISIDGTYIIEGTPLSIKEKVYHQTLLKNIISEDSVLTFSVL